MADDADAQERARRLATEPAQRIVEAARRLIARRGIDRSHVVDIANEAGFSRGLVTYYFGSKDRLLGEVMEADGRAAIERLQELLGPTRTCNDVTAALAQALHERMDQEPGVHMALQELVTLALRKPEFQLRRARLRTAYRDTLAELLAERQHSGALALSAEPGAVAAVLLALGDGIVTEAAADPDWDPTPTIECTHIVLRQVLCSSAAV